MTGQAWSATSGTVAAVGSLPAVERGGHSAAAWQHLIFAVGNPASGGGLAFPRRLHGAPFDASLDLAASVADSEGVVYAGNPYQHSGIGFDDGNAATASDAQMRFGRLRLSNAVGSEMLALPVPLTAQYWNGQGFVTNTVDNCTALAAPTLAFFAQTADNQLASGETSATLNSPFVAGDRRSAPERTGRRQFRLPGSGHHRAGLAEIQLGWRRSRQRRQPVRRQSARPRRLWQTQRQ